MLDTGSIPVSGTKLDAGTVQSLPAFFISPLKTRFFRSLASGLVCHVPAKCGGTSGGMFPQFGGTLGAWGIYQRRRMASAGAAHLVQWSGLVS